MGSFSEIFNGLMSGHKDDEEVFSETCQRSGVFLQSGNSSCDEIRPSRASTGNMPTLCPGRSDLVARRVARLSEIATQQIVEGWTREVDEGNKARHNFSEAKHQVLRSRKRNDVF